MKYTATAVALPRTSRRTRCFCRGLAAAQLRELILVYTPPPKNPKRKKIYPGGTPDIPSTITINVDLCSSQFSVVRG
jgi:hypothetical protein